MDIGLLRVEVFVEARSNDGVVVGSNAEVPQQEVDVRVVPTSQEGVLALTSFSKQNEQVSSTLDILLKCSQLILAEVLLRSRQDEETGLLDLLEDDFFLVQTNLNKCNPTL